MIEFAYMQLPGGISRPMIAVVIEGPRGRRVIDGLLDTGSDRTLFPMRETVAVGVQLPPNADGTIRTAGGVSIPYRLAKVTPELRAANAAIRWNTDVSFADDPINIIHLGGFPARRTRSSRLFRNLPLRPVIMPSLSTCKPSARSMSQMRTTPKPILLMSAK